MLHVLANRLKTLGAEDYLTKPFDVATFLRTIEGALVCVGNRGARDFFGSAQIENFLITSVTCLF